MRRDTLLAELLATIDLATKRFRRLASPMTTRFAAIFIYADGCSLRLDHLLGDPPPRQVVLRTEAQFKEGIFRFRLRVVRRDCREAWYEGRIPAGDQPSRPEWADFGFDERAQPMTSCSPRPTMASVA